MGLLAGLTALADVDLGRSTSGTPYDAYMQPVERVLNSLDGGPASMDKARALLREANSFEYSYTRPYVAASPSATTKRRGGDCKAKALWLCARLDDPSARYVVGKSHRYSRLNHAWVMWKSQGRWWILDPTRASAPIAADQVSPDQYIPLYSWNQRGTYRHSQAKALMSGTRRIAGAAERN